MLFLLLGYLIIELDFNKVLPKFKSSPKLNLQSTYSPFYVQRDRKPNIPKSFECDKIPNHLKFDCYPDDLSVTIQKCVLRGCCWDPVLHVKHENDKQRNKPSPNIPYCYYPQDYPQYTLTNEKSPSEFHFIGNISRTHGRSFAPNDVNDLVVDIMAETTSQLRIKIYDSNNSRYEVPYPEMPSFITPNTTDIQYRIFINTDPFYFAVSRFDTDTFLFDSSVGVFIFADQFIQFSAKLSSPFLYGLGETHDNFLHNIYWSRFTLFNHDTPPRDYNNLYGSHAFYLNMEDSGKANGVFLFNSNAMEITLQPTPAITYRTIGGILDFYFFLGPSPADVISQYTELIGYTFMPPYWSLGFHLCRYNYNSLNNTEMIWKRNRDAKIPFDTQWNDIDYMDNHKDFTYDNTSYMGLDKFVDKLHSIGMHYMVIIDPGISSSEPSGSYEPYVEGLNQGVFIKNQDGTPFEGQVWTSGKTVWVDFTNPNATGYWTKQFKMLIDQVKIDGAWIDMNEPSNFNRGTKDECPNTTYDFPFFVPDVENGVLFYHTVCMSTVQYASIHYNVHNLYGLTESISTYSALSSILKPRRPFIISRSSAPGLGKYSGHWTGDIFSTYTEMKKTIPGILNFNLFGISMIGADICGFTDNTTKELCQRWMELGSFYPFCRNHNDRDMIDQDPAAFNGTIIDSSRIALTARYSLLPYLYTLFYRSHLFGETVARALFFEFPKDQTSYFIDKQFLWGPALLISPVLLEGITTINAYFPKAVWYDFWSGEAVPSTGTYVPLYTPIEKINLHVRGGYILPMQEPDITTTASRKKLFWLLVALDEKQTASGQLIWDHGDQIDSWEKKQYNNITFELKNNTLQSNVAFYQYEESMTLGNVTILGVETSPKQVTVNNKDVNFNYISETMVLYAFNFKVSLKEKFSLQWFNN